VQPQRRIFALLHAQESTSADPFCSSAISRSPSTSLPKCRGNSADEEEDASELAKVLALARRDVIVSDVVSGSHIEETERSP
jgi:hypothetical protein